MKILMVLDSEFPPDIRVEKEAKTLINSGYKVYLACLTKEQRPIKDKFNGITIFRKPISKFMHKTSVGALKFPFYFNFWRKFLVSILSADTFDAIHIHDLPLAKVGWEMKLKFNLKFTLDLHENWPAHIKIARHTNTLLGKLLSSNKQWCRYEELMTKKADFLITVVKEMKERVTRIGVPEKKIYVIPNYIDLEQNKIQQSRPSNQDKASNKHILLYSGGITLHRGLQIVIPGLKKALEQIQNIELWIIGNGSYLNKIKKMTNKLNIEKQVVFYGKIPFNDLLNIMESVDIGLIPHIRTVQTDNSSPNKLFEYMSRSLPILASDCTSVKRIIEDSECGQVYQHDSSSEFSETLLKMIKSKKQLKVYSENARQAVNEKYNWQNAEKNLLKLYDSFS